MLPPQKWAFWKIPEKCFPGGLKTFWQFGNFVLLLDNFQ
jgi:hypothetical protein